MKRGYINKTTYFTTVKNLHPDAFVCKLGPNKSNVECLLLIVVEDGKNRKFFEVKKDTIGKPNNLIASSIYNFYLSKKGAKKFRKSYSELKQKYGSLPF